MDLHEHHGDKSITEQAILRFHLPMKATETIP
ncbi:hypothetical protein BCL93_11532 [Onishia taeanensis]|uniref:Uncharacterized protein n=1 Tax=Onishia taeanensis TaxID=284577 RepID=A0A328XHI8_9GAMM|nr:hypothetical protein BCL93_11532 [Halomonas taeanensis]